MSVEIQEDISIKPYTTFKMGGVVRYFAHIKSLSDLREYISFSEEKKLPLLIFGGGSNVIFPDTGVLSVCLAHIQIDGISEVRNDGEHIYLKVGAGVIWDDAVLYAVSCGLSGIEAMSAIPGTAGATPIQNVGAYGQEIKDTLESVEVYNLETREVKVLSNQDCAFAYRDSIFKHEAKNKYIIISITLKLSKKPPSLPRYPGISEYFEKKGISKPTLSDIRNAIIDIRWMKLPRPEDVPSCGSFFKNPIIPKDHAENLKEKYPSMVCYGVDENSCKVGAGWLIDTVGLKGKSFGNLSLYKNNALVIVNNGQATKKELIELISYIQGLVKETFDILIEPEPIMIEDYGT